VWEYNDGGDDMAWGSLNRAIRASTRLSKTLAIGASRSDLVPEMKPPDMCTSD